MGHEHIHGPGAAHPDQLRHGVKEGEAGVRQVVNQENLGFGKKGLSNTGHEQANNL